jgi:hydrogenase nickel incorporation protein HypA/HybF
MHEYAIVQALVERVGLEARAQGATGVHRLSIRIGELSGVDPDLLTTAFDTFRERTICGDAQLDLQIVAARWECPECGQVIARGAVLTCPVCSLPAHLSQGDEIMLDRIELEVP